MTAADDQGRPGARGTLTIDVEACKGCELCIPACPPGVLSMSSEVNGIGYRFPLLSEGCTGCTACQMVCPDFVFEVYRHPRSRTTTPDPAPAPAPERTS